MAALFSSSEYKYLIMFQTTDAEFTSDDIELIFQAFKDSVCEKPIQEDNTEYDLSAIYRITEAQRWNRLTDQGQNCMIYAKNSHIALVMIQAKAYSEPECIVRLEDITKQPKT